VYQRGDLDRFIGTYYEVRLPVSHHHPMTSTKNPLTKKNETLFNLIAISTLL